MNAIKQGYKQTKVGMIPEDWDVVKLGDIFEIKVGKDLDEKNYSPIKTEEHIYPIYSNTVENRGLYGYSKIKEYQSNSLTVVGRGIGLGTAFSRNHDFSAIGRLLVLKPKCHSNVDFISEYINFKMNIFNESSGIPQLTGISFSTYLLPSPPLKEQEKIAEILTTWDEAISLHVKLIEEKEQLKIGLMQKLLSGEVRFEGFCDKWEEVKINQIFEITRGYVLAVSDMSQEQTLEYQYPVYSSQTKNDGLTGYYKEYLFENCLTWTTDGANAGDVNLRRGKFYCTNVCGVLKSEQGYANQCIAEILNSVTKNYVSYVGNPKLMNNTMGHIKIKTPKTIEEQEAISEVLSLADDALNLLKKELEELKQQKKGLMQKLLTGEVRVMA